MRGRPHGLCKTYLLVDLVKRSPDSKVMVIVAWTSLCNYYKCLLERETRVTWSLYAEGSVRRWNPATEPHVIICYPSLRGIDEHVIDTLGAGAGWGLWLDEAMKLSHFSAEFGVMNIQSMLACEMRLTSLLRVAPWCVMLQYNMHMDTPAWIMNRLDVSVEAGVQQGLLETIRVSKGLLWSGRTFLCTSVRSWRQLRVPEWDTTQQVSDLQQSMQLDESVRC